MLILQEILLHIWLCRVAKWAWRGGIRKDVTSRIEHKLDGVNGC
jgi:hypothetical protein